jgi:hypothetical protein
LVLNPVQELSGQLFQDLDRQLTVEINQTNCRLDRIPEIQGTAKFLHARQRIWIERLHPSERFSRFLNGFFLLGVHEARVSELSVEFHSGVGRLVFAPNLEAVLVESVLASP